MALLPPLEGVFPSRQALQQHVGDWALAQGYCVSVLRSDSRKVELKCDLGGIHRPRGWQPVRGIRRCSSRQSSCPFSLKGRITAEGEWKLKVRNPNHTHPANDLISHSRARRFTAQQQSEIGEMSRIGIAPRQIESTLRQRHPEILVTRQDIYNASWRERMRVLDGKTPTEYLAIKLDEGHGNGEWLHRMELTDENRVKLLFWAHRRSIEYANRYDRVFLFDCTYKTNRYKRPLLHIVGMTPTNDSFSAAFCFLPDEKAESYEWALAAFFSFLDRPWKEPTAAESDLPVLCTDRDLALLKVLRESYAKFPHLLCIWHINKNVQANCKSLFPLDDDYNKFFSLWTAVTMAPTEEGFDKALDVLKKWCEDGGNEEQADALKYLQKVWLIYKEKFVVAWTRQYRHLGKFSLSRRLL
jgi:MULE transposase domain